MITKDFIILFVLYLAVCAALIIALWKIDERVLKLEALVKCLESEIRALRRIIALKGDESDA